MEVQVNATAGSPHRPELGSVGQGERVTGTAVAVLLCQFHTCRLGAAEEAQTWCRSTALWWASAARCAVRSPERGQGWGKSGKGEVVEWLGGSVLVE